MSGTGVVPRIHHPAFEPIRGEPILEVRLGDRQRLAVVLQAAALLSHLAAAGGRLKSGWRELEVDKAGVVRGARVQPGLSVERPQQSLGELLLALFRARDRIPGRGQARRIARGLFRRWQRDLGSRSADKIVTQILDSAPFFWAPTFASARRALAAKLVSDHSSRLRVAGPGRFEHGLLKECADLAGLCSRVESRKARDYWRDPRADPRSVRGEREKLAAARALYLRGQLQRSLELLKSLRAPAARILRAECCRGLGDLARARKALVELESTALSAADALSLAQLAVAVFGDLGLSQEAGQWSGWESVRASQAPRAGLELVAAEAALQKGDPHAADRHLRSAMKAGGELRSSWRADRVRAQLSQVRGDLQDAENLTGRALASSRRTLPRFAAGELWHQLARIRLERGRLVEAERAASHAVRLLNDFNEKSATKAFRTLLEIRLRRGRPAAAHRVLETGVANSELIGAEEHQSLTVLTARLELVGGQPAGAWGRLSAHLDSNQSDTDAAATETARVLAARALGWLGRGAEARELLTDLPGRALACLEQEERPALWALAGNWQRAREAAGPGAIGDLWRKLLRGEPPTAAREWQVLQTLGAYRRARLVFDLQLLAPGSVPTPWPELASDELRRVGAQSFAERLDWRREGTWRALEGFLRPTGSERQELADLFANCGYFDARLSWSSDHGEIVLVPGRGGERELAAPICGGRLRLSAEVVDPALRVLFALAAREFRPRPRPRAELPRVRGMLGHSVAFERALSRLERLSASEVAVLIQGETGTGKELAARQVHRLSARASQTFVAVNCAALSESLLLSDLFGHVRGAFTGADQNRAGIFETARGGTVFLDEIGDLPQAAQGKLLRVLQEGEVRRVGESLPRRVDVRIVTATHRDLAEMMRAGLFRRDLYYRLKVGHVTLPPLRHRERDVLLLADHIAARAGFSMTARARRKLLNYSWPGNVRELANVLQVAIALSEHAILDAEHLELPDEESGPKLGYHQQVEEFRRSLVQQALAASEGNRAEAARRLDLSRQALSYLVRRFGLS